jgi:arsenical pump membrane protein
VTVGLATGAIGWGGLDEAVDPLLEPLAFLLLAVPMAVLLDQLGFFAAVADRIGHGRHLQPGLWVLAAAVTTVLNLDASVVLLTPLYIRIARRHGLDPVAAALPPALLACLASSALPVSNLTNLLAAERFDLSAAQFAVRLGPASLVATAVGYWCQRRWYPLGSGHGGEGDPVPAGALARGLPVVVLVVAGFTVGDALGIPAWAVAAVADLVLVVLVRRTPWRALPVGAAALAALLGILVAAASSDLEVGRILGDGDGGLASLRTVAAETLGANAVNNLPALLLAMPAVASGPPDQIWALLVGVNIGPVLLVSGSLSGLLWLDTARRLEVAVDARTYTRAGLRVGLPALAAAAATVVLTNAVV